MKIKPDDPAFPRAMGWNGESNHAHHKENSEELGMSIRAEFSKAAMTALLTGYSHPQSTGGTYIEVAGEAVRYADALIAELNKE